MTAATDVTRVHVLGAGRMGQGIALVFAFAGLDVTLIDFKPRDAQGWRAFEDRTRVGMDDHPDAERPGNRVDGDVVVRRADPAGGEDIVVARAHRVQRVDDLVLDVGDDAHFTQANPLHIEPGRDLRDILVLRAARENLVADHQHGGGPDAFVAHPLALPRPHDKTRLLDHRQCS